MSRPELENSASKFRRWSAESTAAPARQHHEEQRDHKTCTQHQRNDGERARPLQRDAADAVSAFLDADEDAVKAATGPARGRD